MNAAQYRKAIEALGLNQQAAGRALGISRRQAQRLASGESPITKPIENLLRLMEEKELSHDRTVGRPSPEP